MHQAERSSWLMGPSESDASGVVGVGEGDREHAVVEDDDMETPQRAQSGRAVTRTARTTRTVRERAR